MAQRGLWQSNVRHFGDDLSAKTAVASRADAPTDLRTHMARVNQALLLGIVTFALLCFGGVFVDGMLTVGNLSSMARLAAPLGVLAVAGAIVIMGKNIDLSMIAIVAVTAQGVVHISTRDGFSELRAVSVFVGIAIVVGLFNGWMIAYVGIPALFVTLGTWKLVEGIFEVKLLEGQVYTLPKDSAFLRPLGTGAVLGIDTPIVIAVAVFIVVGLALKYTSYGQLLRATGDSCDGRSAPDQHQRQLQPRVRK
jgi:ribose transport system permease protein